MCDRTEEKHPPRVFYVCKYVYLKSVRVVCESLPQRVVYTIIHTEYPLSSSIVYVRLWYASLCCSFVVEMGDNPVIEIVYIV